MKLKRMQAACTVLLQITAVSKDIYNSFDPIKPTFNFFPSVPASCTMCSMHYMLNAGMAASAWSSSGFASGCV